MKTEKLGKLIINLAQRLDDNIVVREHVIEALTLIKNTYSFESACIYDLDQYRSFILQEHLSEKTIICPEAISLSNFSPSFYHSITNASVTFIENTMDASEGSVLCSLFQADNLLLTSIVIEGNQIIGLVILANIDPQDQEELTPVLSVLSKYVRMRCASSRLKQTRTALENVIDNTGIDIYAIDFNTYEILYANKSMAEPYGGLEKFYGHKCWEVLFPEQNGICEFCPQKHIIDEEGNPTKVYSWDYQRALDGSWFRVFSAAFRWVDGRLAHVVSSVDITENKLNEELISRMANYDPLTNLPNRRKLVIECEERIANKENKQGFLLFIDIDKFKNINDELGHESGDEFLIQLGEFFSSISMLEGNIFRNGGDEFIALLDAKACTEENVIDLCKQLQNRFQKEWILKKGNAICDVSIGISCYPQDGTDSESLISKADQAMYYIKSQGGGNYCFARDIKNK